MRKVFQSMAFTPSRTPPSVASVATQTDPSLFKTIGYVGGREATESRQCSKSIAYVDYLLPQLSQTTDRKWTFGSSAHPSENGTACTTTYEEVTLHRCHKDTKFGLTLWYQTGNDVNCQPEGDGSQQSRTEVFIGEIDPGGIAAKDGRARIGDRILEINGEAVESRDQVVQLLRTDLPFIRLLLSRSSPVQRDDGFTDDLDALECLSFEDENEHCPMSLECIDEEDDATDDTGTTNENDSQRQDSGVGKTDESTRNEESSEQEAFDDCVLSPLSDRSFRNDHQPTSIRFASMDGRESDPDAAIDELPSIFQCQQFYEMLKERCNADFAAAAAANYHQRGGSTIYKTLDGKQSAPYDDYAILQPPPRHYDDIATINRSMAALQLESRQPERHPQSPYESGINPCSSRKVPRMGTKIDFTRQTNPASTPMEKTSTQVGQSGRHPRSNEPPLSSPVDRQDLSQCQNNRNSTGAIEIFDRFQDRRFVGVSPTSGSLQPEVVIKSTSGFDSEAKDHGNVQGRKRESQMCQTDDEGEYESLTPLAYRLPSPVLRCRCLQCTPSRQEQWVENLTQNALRFRAPKTDNKTAEKNSGDASASAPSTSQTGEGTEQKGQEVTEEHEWVVKRRADGSRYITRRPVRHRLLKERARKVEEERACQTTTDDDTTNVLKTSRHWTRDDRRKYMEKNRMKRREKARQRYVEGGSGNDPNPGEESCIVQLSRKKMMKCKGRRMFDDFTTLQELLAHGNRDPHQVRSSNHLLSVTTV